VSALARHIPLGIDLDLTQDDLGHPQHPNLWDEIYRPAKGDPILLCPQCERENPACPEWMYVQKRNGKRVAVHKNVNIKDHPSRETDEHKAVNERTYRIAQKAGFDAYLESASSSRDRITDVLIKGSVALGVETQLSRQTAKTTKRRTALARRDGITSMWVTRNDAAALINQAPWALYRQMPWHLIKDLNEPMYVVGGIRSIVIDKCGSRGELCPHKKAGIPCTGWNAYFDAKQSQFDDHIIKSASGLMVPMQRVDGRKSAWSWVSADDAARYRELAYEQKQPAPKQPKPDTRRADEECHYTPGQHRDERVGLPRESGAAVIVPIKAPMPERPVIDLGSRPPRGRCQHWIGSQRRYCNFRSAVGYINGWYCDNHSPAAMAHLRSQLGA